MEMYKNANTKLRQKYSINRFGKCKKMNLVKIMIDNRLYL